MVFGLAASLAMCLLQLKSGIDVAFPNNFNSQTVLIVLGLIVGISFTVSTVSGLDKGIKALSNLNTILVILLLIYVIFFGPTLFIFQTFINSIGDYASSLLEVSFKLLPYQGLTEWTDNWTLMFLIWWIALGPCVGIFIARISKGRTLREYMLAVVLIPTIFSVLWFAAFGGSGLYIELFGQGGIGSLVMESYSKALFELFEYFPLSQFLDVLTLFLIFIFLVTTAQAGCFVISMISAGGITNPPTLSKLVWAIVIILISLGTVLSGGIEVAKAIAVSGAILFSAVLIVLIATFLLVIRKEDTRRFHVKKK